MRDPIFSEPHNIYQVKTSLTTLISGIFVSGAMCFLGSKAEDYAYLLVGIFFSGYTLLLALKFFISQQIILGTSRMILPGIFPGQRHVILYRNVVGQGTYKLKGSEHLLIKTKSGKTFDFLVDSIKHWNKFYRDLKSKVPELEKTSPTPESLRNIMIIAIGTCFGLYLAYQKEFIEKHVAIGSAVAILLMVFAVTQAKRFKE